MKNFCELSGLALRRKDITTFISGMMLPPIMLFLIFLGLRHGGILNDMNYFELLLGGRKKLIYYFAIGFIEEFLFRGLLFGFLCKKISCVPVDILLTTAVFSFPHAINQNAPVSILLIFSFMFGILACEMRCFTRSIWMSTAFHWTWNYSIVSIFMATNTNQYIYGWITIEIIILVAAFYWLMKSQKKPFVIW